MIMSVQLTEGVIPLLFSGKLQPTDVNPVLQVTDLLPLPAQTSAEEQERYRLVLSDGSLCHQGMLATQRNDLVRSQQMQKGSVVLLKEYVCNWIRDRAIIIIIDLDVIVKSCKPIGDPKLSPPRSATSRSPQTFMAGSVPRSANSPIYPQPLQPTYNQPPGPPMYANRGPTAKKEAPPRIIPIAALNPSLGRWTIKARVTAQTDKLYDKVEDGEVYYISKGSVKPASKAFNHLKNDHEILLDNTSTIETCFDDDSSIPHQQLHFRPN